MEKIKLNNQIVSMRKFVKQAKVHAINKLVKQIKLLQNRKGNETQVQKAKRKADRFLEAVALLKKTRPDEVSKLALSKAKDWKDVLQQKNASLHDRCIAMLANYGAVQKEVEAFYKANEELVLKISDYIAQWEEKSKSSKDSPKTSKMVPEKKLIENVQKEKFKNENLLNSKKNKSKTVVRTKNEFNTALKIPHDDRNVEAETSDSDDDQIVKLQQINNSSDPIKDIKATKNVHNFNNPIEIKESDNSDDEEMIDVSYENNNKREDTKDSSDEESDSSDEHNEEMIEVSLKNNNKGEDAKDSSNDESNTNKVQESESKLDLLLKRNNNAKSKLKAIALLNLNELEGLDEIPLGNSIENKESDGDETSEDDANEASEERNTDPFFLGHNKEDSVQNKTTDPFFLGNNKEDTNVKKFDGFSKESDACVRDSSYSFKNRTQYATNFLHKRKDEFSPDKSSQKSPYIHRNASQKFKNERKSDFSFKKGKFASTNYNNKFQERGRKDFNLKSKFDPTKDTYNKKPFKNTSRNYGNKDDSMSLKNKQPFKKNNANGPLHPSWEAKRKQKELLSTSFQGKRMVFND